MNIDTPSDSDNVNSCEVTSKYFSGCVMDESLSEFQEKKTFTKAKTSQKVQKQGTSKPKTKKIKKIRGQKDIRTILKNNELIAYSSEFDKICKQSGIDVDAEQLQLAIALSKSLQQTKTEVEEDSNSSPLTTQERTGKIRTTLQEYGFVVPEVKITATKSRKLKKLRKHYRLLQATEDEKQQIISDKYSQVLFASLNNTKVNDCIENANNSAQLYCRATNALYEDLKDNTLLYVDNLLEKSPSFVGCLLKDWNKIPGRAISPTIELPNIKFERIECTSEELDSVLSGDLKIAQEIVKNKYSLFPIKVAVDSSEVESNLDKEFKMDVDCTEILDHENIPTNRSTQNNKETISKQSNILEENSVTQNARSCSPDIFDDEVSEIDSSPNILITQEYNFTNKNVVQQSHNTMDLTECIVNLNSQTTVAEPIIALSQGTNTTKRKSNDFMDMTACVVGSSQPIRENIVEENIDLTQNSDDECDETMGKKISTNKDIQSLDLTQSSPDSIDELPVVQISGRESMDDTIILNDVNDSFGNEKIIKPLYLESLDKTARPRFTKEYQSYDRGPISVDSENEIEIPTHSTTQNTILKENNIRPTENVTSDDIAVNKMETFVSGREFMDDTMILNEKNEHRMTGKNFFGNKKTLKPLECEDLNKTQHARFTKEHQSYEKRQITVDSEDEIDISINTQNMIFKERSISPIENITSNKIDTNQELPVKVNNISKSKSESFFEEFVHQHSENSSRENTDILCVDEGSNNSTIKDKDGAYMNEKVDLTQKSDTSEEVIEIDKNISPKILLCSSSLGKIGDVSIDYDEVFDDMVRSHASSTSQSKSCSSKSLTTDLLTENTDKPSNSDLVSNSSQNSEVFEISDKELDYSIHRSKIDFNPKPNFDFGGISIMDEIPDLPSFRPSTNNIENRSMSDSFLPTVDMGGTNIDDKGRTKSCNSVTSTPSKESSKHVIAKTPMNGEYIIKTDGVTPMQNYEIMTTPERNAELDKYGLKPFKRKRAIQLLTHLYNQTHPIVESMENLPSPSKRFKPSTNPQTTPAKRKSPKKNTGAKSQKNVAKSPRKDDDMMMMNDEGDVEASDKENDIYNVTDEVPDIRDIECLEEDWVFQKREKAKLHSCRVPLHIAFHNYVIARGRLREAILRYEPVNIDQIHKGLVANGFRYDPKDLLKFMDKKCITVKTTDNNARNKKHY